MPTDSKKDFNKPTASFELALPFAIAMRASSSALVM
jgi:hypothetical protein